MSNADLRAGALNVTITRDSPRTLTFVGLADLFAGTWTATADGDALTTSTVGDDVVVVFTGDETSGPLIILCDSDIVITGRLSVSTRGSVDPDGTVLVRLDEQDITLTVVGGGIPGLAVETAARIAGDIAVTALVSAEATTRGNADTALAGRATALEAFQASVPGTYAAIEVTPIPALTGVQAFGFGDSWLDTSGRYSVKKAGERFATAHAMLELDQAHNFAADGATTGQVLTQVQAFWTPNSLGLVWIGDGGLINDRSPGGSGASVDTVTEEFRSILVDLTSSTSLAYGTTSFQFGPGWVNGASSTAGAYVDIVFSGDAVTPLFTAGATAGSATIKNTAGTTRATVEMGGYSRSFTKSVPLTGAGVGTHTYRIQVVSGTVTVTGFIIPSAAPPTIVWQQGIITAATNLPTLAAACETIAAGFDTVHVVSPGDDFDEATMLGPDGTHLNDYGNWHYVTRATEILRAA